MSIHAAVMSGSRLSLDGLVAMLRAGIPDVTVVATAFDWRDLDRRLIGEPDVVVLELGAGDVTWGLDGLAAIHERGLRTVAISPRRDPAWLRAAAEAGADAVVTRFEGADDLVEAVRAVVAGGGSAPGVAGDDEHGRVGEPTLGAREQEALRLFASGLTIREAAREMATTEETVKSYIKRARRKYRAAGLQLGTKIELRRHGIRQGWLAPD
jgi:two-component system, NarL family, uhpT operon response regulator UhpA